ncbi:nanos homolog 1-like [Stegostoma tigrinum]|uniref:nanos homolog 1-like n=1 Tax=Stegostoma tigrinum TaxID=3053191 RepID=UPI00202B90F4|nr:nanos homolog 1-like [Stegostoma tigrinum]
MADRAFDIWSDYLGLSKVIDSFVQSGRRQAHWRVEPEDGRLGPGETVGRDLKAGMPQLQHKPAALRSHHMDLGAGLFLTINVKDVENRRCIRGEASRQLGPSARSRHPAAFTPGDRSIARQPCPGSPGQTDSLKGLAQSILVNPRGGLAEFATSPPGQGETRRTGVAGARTGCRIDQRSFICTFCKQNGESRNIYASHVLRDEDGRTVCPILRRYTCPVCKATGDSAHTKRFCQSLRGNYRSTYKKTPRGHCLYQRGGETI